MKQMTLYRIALALLLVLGLSGCVPVCIQAAQPTDTGGITILKTDLTGNPLPGAEYRLVREVTAEEANDSGLPKALLRVDKGHITVVSDGASVTTDSSGFAVFSGIRWGSYYLVETKAPEGYQRMEDPIRIRIHKYSHLTAEDNVRDDNGALIDNTVHILTVNTPLPPTGSVEEIRVAAVMTAGIFSLTSLILLLFFRPKHKAPAA